MYIIMPPLLQSCALLCNEFKYSFPLSLTNVSTGSFDSEDIHNMTSYSAVDLGDKHMEGKKLIIYFFRSPVEQETGQHHLTENESECKLCINTPHGTLKSLRTAAVFN